MRFLKTESPNRKVLKEKAKLLAEAKIILTQTEIALYRPTETHVLHSPYLPSNTPLDERVTSFKMNVRQRTNPALGIPNALVEVWQDGFRIVQGNTDAEGFFEVGNFDNTATINVIVAATGYITACHHYTLRGMPLPVTIELKVDMHQKYPPLLKLLSARHSIIEESIRILKSKSAIIASLGMVVEILEETIQHLKTVQNFFEKWDAESFLAIFAEFNDLAQYLIVILEWKRQDLPKKSRKAELLNQIPHLLGLWRTTVEMVQTLIGDLNDSRTIFILLSMITEALNEIVQQQKIIQKYIEKRDADIFLPPLTVLTNQCNNLDLQLARRLRRNILDQQFPLLEVVEWKIIEFEHEFLPKRRSFDQFKKDIQKKKLSVFRCIRPMVCFFKYYHTAELNASRKIWEQKLKQLYQCFDRAIHQKRQVLMEEEWLVDRNQLKPFQDLSHEAVKLKRWSRGLGAIFFCLIAISIGIFYGGLISPLYFIVPSIILLGVIFSHVLIKGSNLEKLIKDYPTCPNCKEPLLHASPPRFYLCDSCGKYFGITLGHRKLLKKEKKQFINSQYVCGLCGEIIASYFLKRITFYAFIQKGHWIQPKPLFYTKGPLVTIISNFKSEPAKNQQFSTTEWTYPHFPICKNCVRKWGVPKDFLIPYETFRTDINFSNTIQFEPDFQRCIKEIIKKSNGISLNEIKTHLKDSNIDYEEYLEELLEEGVIYKVPGTSKYKFF